LCRNKANEAKPTFCRPKIFHLKKEKKPPKKHLKVRISKIIKCQYCGIEFETKSHNAKFCSRKCNDKHKYKNNPEKFKAQTKKYREDNKKKVKAYKKQYKIKKQIKNQPKS
jgi:hypothetical protein